MSITPNNILPKISAIVDNLLALLTVLLFSSYKAFVAAWLPPVTK